LVGKTQSRSKLEQRNNTVYKMPKRMQNTTLGHCFYIKDQKNETNGRNRQRILEDSTNLKDLLEYI